MCSKYLYEKHLPAWESWGRRFESAQPESIR